MRSATAAEAEMLASSSEIRVSDGIVEFWLDRRLPFQPQGEMLTVRRELRGAIATLACSPHQFLHATYCAEDAGFCDLENVLLYNVGSGAFRSISAFGIGLERQREQPPAAPSGRALRHYHRYEVREPHEPGTDLAAATEVAIEPLSSSSKPHSVWWAVAGAPAPPAPLPMILGPFALEVVICSPRYGAPMAGLIKPLLDGIIAAHHTDPTPDAAAIERLAAATGWKTDEVRRRLTSPGQPILGSRSVVRAYREFVAWNPADDRCERCSIFAEPASSWSLRFRLSPVRGALHG